MRRNVPNFILLASCLAMAAAGHAVFLYQWSQSHFMTGINDGLSQILPFKKLLYEQYTDGEFFYSFDFGLGAGTFSELSYYFSTSIFFLATAAVVFGLESAGILAPPDILFWANAAVFISIARLAFVLFAASKFFSYIGAARVPAFIGASIYGISGMYFRHAVYWDFFADAFLWLPLLLFGVEKIFRDQKPGWFLLGVSVSLFDNFYFSYINFLLAGIYILVRFFVPLAGKEIHRAKAAGHFLLAGLLGFGISAVSFIPAVYAYLNNHRPPFQQEIEWFDFTDNILFTSRFIILPAIFVLFLFSASLYRDRLFRFFAILGIIGIVLHFSPMAASVFNGFSAPQYRWEYFLALAAGGATAAGLSKIHTITERQFALAALLAIGAYMHSAFIDPAFEPEAPWTMLAFALLIAAIFLLYAAARWKRPAATWLLAGFILVSQAVFTNVYQVENILDAGGIDAVSQDLLTGEEYDDPEIRGLLQEIRRQEDGGPYRIDWMEGVRNNTPLVQDFQGLSAYSSILNKNLLYFYLYDLEIDMGRESVSRYAGLGNRANLHSLLQGDYAIKETGDPNVPYGFTELASSAHFTVYKNRYPLPFARPASKIYQERQLDGAHPLLREHAMLTGIVLNGGQAVSPLPEASEATADYRIEPVDAVYRDGRLQVDSETGGIDLVNEGPAFKDGDLYVSFHLENPSPGTGFLLDVNGFETSRKANDSIYRTYIDDLTIRVPADETIRIRMPEGTYELEDIQIFQEPYDILKRQAAEESGLRNLQMGGSRVSLQFDNAAADPFLALAIPYERGWSAKVNGKPVPIEKANYAFMGVPIEKGMNDVKLVYRPPFFFISLLVTLISLLLGTLYATGVRKRGKAR